jgi:hypothetical protein
MRTDIANVEWRRVAFHVIKCRVNAAIKEKEQRMETVQILAQTKKLHFHPLE